MTTDAELAHRLADETAQQLSTLQASRLAHTTFDPRGGYSLEREADSLAHEFLVEELSAIRPDDVVLSEEGEDDSARLAAERVWIVDPLDGSASFGRGGADWAVHVALVTEGEISVAAIACPGLDYVGSSWQPNRVPRVAEESTHIAVGRSRAWAEGEVLADALNAELIVCSSAGAKASLVLTGQADLYVHAGPLWEWDVCAPVGVAVAAGLTAVGPNGRELDFNQPEPHVPGVLIGDGALVERAVAALLSSGWD